MAYALHRDRRERAAAIAAVALVHAVLALVLLSGFHVRTIQRAVEQLKAFDIAEQPPPPPAPEPPQPLQARAAKEEAAPPNIKSKPAPVVAPPAKLPLPSPVATAVVKGPEGADRTAGASDRPGSGTGAGGQGGGFGGGGDGGFGGYTPARLVRNLSNRDYRRLAGDRLPAGRAAVAIRINPDSSISNCRVVGSSGDSWVDAGLCGLVVQRLRFRPAMDAAGRPVGQDITYIATWRP